MRRVFLFSWYLRSRGHRGILPPEGAVPPYVVLSASLLQPVRQLNKSIAVSPSKTIGFIPHASFLLLCLHPITERLGTQLFDEENRRSPPIPLHTFDRDLTSRWLRLNCAVAKFYNDFFYPLKFLL